MEVAQVSWQELPYGVRAWAEHRATKDSGPTHEIAAFVNLATHHCALQLRRWPSGQGSGHTFAPKPRAHGTLAAKRSANARWQHAPTRPRKDCTHMRVTHNLSKRAAAFGNWVGLYRRKGDNTRCPQPARYSQPAQLIHRLCCEKCAPAHSCSADNAKVITSPHPRARCGPTRRARQTYAALLQTTRRCARPEWTRTRGASRGPRAKSTALRVYGFGASGKTICIDVAAWPSQHTSGHLAIASTGLSIRTRNGERIWATVLHETHEAERREQLLS